KNSPGSLIGIEPIRGAVHVARYFRAPMPADSNPRIKAFALSSENSLLPDAWPPPTQLVISASVIPASISFKTAVARCLAAASWQSPTTYHPPVPFVDADCGLAFSAG